MPDQDEITDDRATVDALQELEQERCCLITEGRTEALALLLADTLVHVHATGVVHDKAMYLANVARNPRLTEREDLQIRVFGDVAIMMGRQINRAPDQGQTPTKMMAIQVWARRNGRWQQEAFQATR